MEASLIDEYRFLALPVIAGTGKRFFKDGMNSKGLELVKSEALDKGVMLPCCKPV
jgi:dihydrofolate reductase